MCELAEGQVWRTGTEYRKITLLGFKNIGYWNRYGKERVCTVKAFLNWIRKSGALNV